MDIKKYMQVRLDEVGDDYRLKDNDELIDIIASFGCGMTEFHTADIGRLIKENEQLQLKNKELVEALALIAEYVEVYGDKPSYAIPCVKMKIIKEIYDRSVK